MNPSLNPSLTDIAKTHSSSEGGSIGWVKIRVPPKEANQSQVDYTIIRYDEFVSKLIKPGTREDQMGHALLGMAAEVGEAIDPIKAYIYYGKQIDLENVMEELGDLRFYMQALMNVLKISEQQVLQYNADKLAKRYASLSFSQQAAIDRADKEPKV